MTQAKSKRKKLIVERQVQGALGFRIAGHWLVFMIASLSFTIILRMIGNIEQASLYAMVALALKEQSVAIVVILAFLPWFINDAFKLSNRFAGPVVRLRGAIKALSHGDEPAPLQFRKGDFWGELASEFNELHARIAAEREELKLLRGAVEELRAGRSSTAEDYREMASAGGNS